MMNKRISGSAKLDASIPWKCVNTSLAQGREESPIIALLIIKAMFLDIWEPSN